MSKMSKRECEILFVIRQDHGDNSLVERVFHLLRNGAAIDSLEVLARTLRTSVEQTSQVIFYLASPRACRFVRLGIQLSATETVWGEDAARLIDRYPDLGNAS